MRATVIIGIAIIGLVLGACAAEEIPIDATDAASVEGDHDDDGMTSDFWFGEPAEASGSTRIIEIEANDDFTFDPAEVSVKVGETVTFRVINTGKLPHDFTIGDAEIQDEHDAEMSGGDMHGEARTRCASSLMRPGSSHGSSRKRPTSSSGVTCPVTTPSACRPISSLEPEFIPMSVDARFWPSELPRLGSWSGFERKDMPIGGCDVVGEL